MIDNLFVDNVQGLDNTQSSIGKSGKISSINQTEFLKHLSSTLLNGLYIFDYKKRLITFINQQYTNLTGYSLEDIQSKTKENTFINFFHPEDRDNVSGYIDEMESLKDNEIREISYRFKRKDGQWVWFLSRETVYSRFADGNIHEYIGSFLDITPQKLEEEKFRNLANSMPQLVWTSDPDGSVDYYNDKYRELIGITKKRGKYIWAPALHPDDVKRCEKAWANAVKNGTIYEVEQRVRVQGNRYEWFLSRGLPIKNSHGKIIKWYGTATNIHKMKQLEQQKDEFIATASHELKTPITTLKAYTHFLISYFKKLDNQTSTMYLQKMEAQVNRLIVLISDLLDMTKIQAGQLQLRLITFNLNQLIMEIAEEMQLTTRQKIKTILDHDIYIYADRERIGQVLTNFISNACKFSPPSKEIIIGTRVINDQLELRVQDFGSGIPKEKQARVFERYYQVEDPSLAAHPGLGLGLYISKQIIKRHHGKIWFESQSNVGSSFYFSLPLKPKKL